MLVVQLIAGLDMRREVNCDRANLRVRHGLEVLKSGKRIGRRPTSPPTVVQTIIPTTGSYRQRGGCESIAFGMSRSRLPSKIPLKSPAKRRDLRVLKVLGRIREPEFRRLKYLTLEGTIRAEQDTTLHRQRPLLMT